MKLKLIRDIDSGESTIGRLYCEGDFLSYTLENPWLNNTVGLSCIPPGIYKLGLRTSPNFSPRYGHDMVEVKDVPNRSYILFHKGNTNEDTRGCILLGETKGIDFIGNSSKAYNKFYPIISNCKEIEIQAAEGV